jgi:hypothetical protein
VKLKNIFKATTTAACVLLFASCSNFFGYDFTKQEDVDKLKGVLEKDLGAEVTVYEISFVGFSSDGFSSVSDVASVIYAPDGEGEIKSRAVSLTGGQSRDTHFSEIRAKDYRKSGGQKLSDMDMSNITSNLNKAIAVFEAEPVNLSFSGLGIYTITLNKDPQKVSHDFTLQSKGDSKMTTKPNGRLATETEYYELTFVADAGGNVELKD